MPPSGKMGCFPCSAAVFITRISHQVLSRNVEDACVYKACDGRTPEAYLTVR